MGLYIVVGNHTLSEESPTYQAIKGALQGDQAIEFDKMVASPNRMPFESALDLIHYFRTTVHPSGSAGAEAATQVIADAASSQISEMAEGAKYVFDGDAWEQTKQTMADQYTARILMHQRTNGGNLDAAMDSAVGWRMVTADMVGATSLDEGLSEIDFNSGRKLDSVEANQRTLFGVSGLSGTAAVGTNMTLRASTALLRTQTAQEMLLSAQLRWGSMNFPNTTIKPATALVGRMNPAPVTPIKTGPPTGFGSAEEYGQTLLGMQHTEVTGNMQAHATAAAQRVDSLGRAALTPKQQNALGSNPGLYGAFSGNRIDILARRAIMNDPKIGRQLPNLRSNYTSGPYFSDPLTGRWWDMTTPAQWRKHVLKYGQNGTPLPTR